MISCSVLLIQYNPAREKLIRTLFSIIRQRNVCIQLIIGDDGSEEDYFLETEKMVIAAGIIDYCLLKNETNMGTVYNVWNAVQHAKYDHLSFLSPGDYYYDENTLSDVFSEMEMSEAQLLFGKMSSYRYKNNELSLVEISHPYYMKPYKDLLNGGDYTTVQRNLIVYRDYICGASYYWDRSIFVKYLERIVGKVVYMEDIISAFVLLDEVKMKYLNRFVTWYEYGEGVSTTSDKKWKKILDSDQNTFFGILRDLYPDSKLVQRANELQKIENIGGIRARVLKALCFPDRFLYLLIHVVLFREKNTPPNMDFINSLYGEVGAEGK